MGICMIQTNVVSETAPTTGREHRQILSRGIDTGIGCFYIQDATQRPMELSYPSMCSSRIQGEMPVKEGIDIAKTPAKFRTMLHSRSHFQLFARKSPIDWPGTRMER